jgi:hypothetical protein
MAALEKNGPSDFSTQVAGRQQQQQQQQQQRQPGARWMNKRAEEEYQRAMEYIVDKDFNLGRLSNQRCLLIITVYFGTVIEDDS